jgi:pre-mRNA-splicing factor 18
MDLLKKEMERKKRALQVAKLEQGGSKFLKTSELRRIQEEQEDRDREEKRKLNSLVEKSSRNKQQETVESPSSAKKRKRPNQDGVDASDKKKHSLGDLETNKKSKSTNDAVSKKNASDVESLTSEEVMQRLRALGLPIQMFGETPTHRKTRLKEALENQKNVMAGLSEMEEFRLGSGHGIRNTFLEREKKGNDVAQDDEKVARKQEKEDDGHDNDDDDDPVKRIYRFFKGLLRQWEDDLAARPEAVKRTAAGRNETKTLKQCKDYIRPLFKLCKTRRLDPSLMSHILKIVEFCQAGEFVKANDAYIDIAIGRAAWPIGVTQVGIHARTGRAKIESANVAHVMNSELQRKYLTSVKRLMAYYQKKREDVAPSKKVLN